MKRGFTLAEVLITLGVIGVVAAITMPTLIKNYQKHVWVNQLKKSVSTIENGFKLAMANDEVMELENTKLIQSMGESGSRDNEAFFNEFKKYFKVIKIRESGFDEMEGYKTLSGVDMSGLNDAISNGIYFADGSLLIMKLTGDVSKLSPVMCNNAKSLGGNLCEEINTAYFDIDVNGDKKPNQFGRDRFGFILGNNGRLYPIAGKDNALFIEQKDLAINSNYWKASPFYNCNTSGGGMYNGLSCAARIMENGWKMDY